jgi:SAM-dependent methyltransferase
MLSLARKYLTPSSYMHRVARVAQRLAPNLIVDRLVHSEDWDALVEVLAGRCELATLEIVAGEVERWARRYFPRYLSTFGTFHHKKLLEFYITFRLLDPHEQHVVMDAAGGTNGYLGSLSCRRKILQDMRIEPSTRAALGPEVDYVEGDAGAIPLPDGSVDRISAHHSFEHFQGDSDTGFIREVQRLLAPEGRCCIVPLFVAKRYVEITNQVSSRYRFDSRSRRVIDPTATIPGSGYSGHYARIYDVPALRRRILDAIDPSRFELGIYQLTMEGRPLPDMSLECHRAVTGVNYPYRAFTIRRAP